MFDKPHLSLPKSSLLQLLPQIYTFNHISLKSSFSSWKGHELPIKFHGWQKKISKHHNKNPGISLTHLAAFYSYTPPIFSDLKINSATRQLGNLP